MFMYCVIPFCVQFHINCYFQAQIRVLVILAVVKNTLLVLKLIVVTNNYTNVIKYRVSNKSRANDNIHTVLYCAIKVQE